MVVMVMMTGIIPWLTVNDNLIASDNERFQHLASVHRFVCRTVVRAVGVVRAIVDDDMLTMGIELSQDSFFSA